MPVEVGGLASRGGGRLCRQVAGWRLPPAASCAVAKYACPAGQSGASRHPVRSSISTCPCWLPACRLLAAWCHSLGAFDPASYPRPAAGCSCEWQTASIWLWPAAGCCCEWQTASIWLCQGMARWLEPLTAWQREVWAARQVVGHARHKQTYVGSVRTCAACMDIQQPMGM